MKNIIQRAGDKLKLAARTIKVAVGLAAVGLCLAGATSAHAQFLTPQLTGIPAKITAGTTNGLFVAGVPTNGTVSLAPLNGQTNLSVWVTYWSTNTAAVGTNTLSFCGTPGGTASPLWQSPGTDTNYDVQLLANGTNVLVKKFILNTDGLTAITLGQTKSTAASNDLFFNVQLSHQ